MPVSTVTCPACQRSFHRATPGCDDAPVRCPACGCRFRVADDGLPITPPSLFGAPFVAAVAFAVLVGGSLVVAVLLYASSVSVPRPVASVPEPDDRAAAGEAERRGLDEERQAVDRERRKLQAARLVADADALAAKGQLADAAQGYERALRLEPNSGDAKAGLTAVRARAAAADQAEATERKREQEVATLLADGRQALAAKRYADAVRILEAARQAAPGHRAVVQALTEAQAGQDAEQAEQTRQAEVRGHVAAGKAAMAAERYADAVREYTAALRQMPDDLELQQAVKVAEAKLAGMADREKREAAFANLLDRAEKALAARRYNDALAAAGPALRLVPDDRDALRVQRAAQAGLKAARAKNAALLAQAEEASRVGRIEEARQLAEEAAQNWPEDDRAARAARTAARLADTAQASQAAYLRFLQEATLAMNAARYADAVTAYTEALRLVPADLDIQRNLRRARAALERDARVRQEYDRLMRAGTASLAQRRFADATAAFTQARQLVPDDLAAANGLSKARYGKALTDGQHALTGRRKAEAGVRGGAGRAAGRPAGAAGAAAGAVAAVTGGAQKNPDPLAEARTPDLLTGPVHPFGSLAALSAPPSGRLRAHSFASPPHDGFAFIEENGEWKTVSPCRSDAPKTSVFTSHL